MRSQADIIERKFLGELFEGDIRMSEDGLRVDPAEVLVAADHVDVAADGLRSDHGSAHTRIGAAKSGWIGSSATALAATAAKWEEDSARHYGELIGRVEALRSAASMYASTDSQEGAAIDTAGSHLGSMGL